MKDIYIPFHNALDWHNEHKPHCKKWMKETKKKIYRVFKDIGFNKPDVTGDLKNLQYSDNPYDSTYLLARGNSILLQWTWPDEIMFRAEIKGVWGVNIFLKEPSDLSFLVDKIRNYLSNQYFCQVQFDVPRSGDSGSLGGIKPVTPRTCP